MERHPYFDLWLHSTDELTAFLSNGVIERSTLHEWPLSCVQLLKLNDGSQLIYKSQLRATTVEPDFFKTIQDESDKKAHAIYSLLPKAILVGYMQNSVAMFIEFIDAPRLEDQSLDEASIIEHGIQLQQVMEKLPSNLPVYTDISSTEKWIIMVSDTLSMLKGLIESEKFKLHTMAGVKALENFALSASVLAAFQRPIVLNHHDLGGDNVFLTPDGYKIIDWQRPVRGPIGLDLANYLTAMGIDPLQRVSPAILGVFQFLRLRWLVECKTHWFPPGEIYDRQVADLSEQILQL